MKKRIFVYIGSFASMILFFSICYFIGYEKSIEKFTSDRKIQPTPIVKQEQAKQEPEDEEKTVETAKEKNTIIAGEAVLVLQSYNKKKTTTVEETLDIPSQFIGMSREQVVAYLDDYMENLSLEEYLEGLCAYEMVSFSSDKLVLKKTFDTDTVEFRFYVIAENNEVVVYYSDKKTVYQYTGISVDSLYVEEQNQLKYGILIKDEKELFGLLENFSS